MNFLFLKNIKNTPKFRIIAACLVIFMLSAAGAIYVREASSRNTPLIVQKLPPTTITSLTAAATSASKITTTSTNMAADTSKQALLGIKKSAHQIPKAATVTTTRDVTDTLNKLLTVAYQAYQGGDLNIAQTHYLDARKLAPYNLDALLGLAVIAQNQKKDAVAIHYYDNVLSLDSRNAVAHAGMSTLHVSENSDSHLKKLINEQQNSPALYFALANYYAAQAHWSEAQQAYFNAYQLQENNAEIAFNLAVTLEHLGQKKQAAHYYQRALELDINNHIELNHTAIEQRALQLIEKND